MISSLRFKIFTGVYSSLSKNACRQLSQSKSSPLFTLRQKTGLAYNLCREALNKHQDNVDEAEAWLKAQALAHGYQKATKVKSRSAREGLVCLATSTSNRLATLVEINCETDFVAKNENFKDFAVDVAQDIASKNQNFSNSNDSGQPLWELISNESQLSHLQDRIVSLISKLGENIRISRAIHLKVPDQSKDMMIFGQVHAKVSGKSVDDLSISVGRYAAVLALNSPRIENNESRDSLNVIGNRLCQHIIGYSPQYIELPENVKKNLLRIESEKMQKSAEVNDGTDNQEEFSDEEASLGQSTNSRDDWPSIMDQTLIMSDDTIVRDYCKENDVSIVHFRRFECGN